MGSRLRYRKLLGKWHRNVHNLTLSHVIQSWRTPISRTDSHNAFRQPDAYFRLRPRERSKILPTPIDSISLHHLRSHVLSLPPHYALRDILRIPRSYLSNGYPCDPIDCLRIFFLSIHTFGAFVTIASAFTLESRVFTGVQILFHISLLSKSPLVDSSNLRGSSSPIVRYISYLDT